jgi:hypothetical protein
MSTRTRSYTELITFRTFNERFDYLSLRASVGESTFGFDRWINQQFYRSTQWRRTRDIVIARDLGLDLGVEDYLIHDRPIIHHMNPMRVEDIDEGDPDILDPEYLITTCHNTHNAIHYGDASLLPEPFVERRPGDTRLW